MSRLRTLPILLALAYAPAALAQGSMQPGLWHLTTKSTTNGKADVQEQDECLTPKELSDLNKYFAPELEGITAKCQRAQHKTADKSIAYHMKCVGKGFSMDVESAVRVEGPRSFTATMTVDTKTTKEHVLVKADVVAAHTGPCPGKK